MNNDYEIPGGDDEILEDRDLNQIVNEEDQGKVVNNDMEQHSNEPAPMEEKESKQPSAREEAKDSKPLS